MSTLGHSSGQDLAVHSVLYGIIELRACEVCAFEMGPMETRATEVYVREIGALKVRAMKTNAPHLSSVKIRTSHNVRTVEIRSRKVPSSP